jgi:hypothetical protein
MKKPRFLKKIFLALLAGAAVFGCRPLVELQHPEDYFNMTVDANTRLSTIFEGFWHGMNNNYIFWDVDPTDWDAVYDQYKPKFEALGTLGRLSGADVALMRGYFQDMLKDIVDGHYTLTSDQLSDAEGALFVHPSIERYERQFAGNYDAIYESEWFVERSINYDTGYDGILNHDFIDAVKNSIPGGFQLFTRKIIYFDGTIKDFAAATGYKTESIGGVDRDMLYFHFSSFFWEILFNDFFAVFPGGEQDANYLAITAALAAYGGAAASAREACDYSNFGANGVPQGDLAALVAWLAANNPEKTAAKWLDALIARAAIDHFNYFFTCLTARQNSATGNPVCGAIIDLRGNGGGVAKDLSTLWGRIVPHDWTFAKKKFKLGENRLDHTSPVDFKIYKAPSNDYGGIMDIPLVLVVSKGSVSASDVTALFFNTLPNGFVAGGTTWGGIGALGTDDTKSINAGQFSVGNGVISMVYTPGLQIIARDGASYEGKGIPPDYPVPFDYNNMTSGIDDRLNKAIRIVRKKQ